jgi:hypothetical protein
MRKIVTTAVARTLLTVPALGTLLIAAPTTMPSAHADLPRVGQPCDTPARVVSLARGTNIAAGPWLMCSVSTGLPGMPANWAPFSFDGLSTTQTMDLGGPCRAPSGFTALALDGDFALGGGVYYASCINGRWSPFRS